MPARQGSCCRAGGAADQSALMGHSRSERRAMVRDHQRALGQGRAGRAGRQVLSLLSRRRRFRPSRSSPSILARPEGLSAVERSFAGGALDFQRGNLFDPNAMRVLPPEGPGDDGLVQRLTRHSAARQGSGLRRLFLRQRLRQGQSAPDRRRVRLHARHAVRRRQRPYGAGRSAGDQHATARERRLARRRLLRLGRRAPSA